MRDFNTEQTIKTVLSLIWHERLQLWKAIARPLLAFIPAFLFYVGVYYFMIPVEDIAAGEPVDPAIINPWRLGIVMLSALPMFLPAAAMSMNWQTFVMTGKAYDALTNPSWWDRFKSYLRSMLILFGAFFIGELLLLGVFAIAVSIAPAIAVIAVLAVFVAIIFLMPLVMRLQLLFPALAAGVADTSFRNVLNLTEGKGWKIFLTIFLANLVISLGVAGVMIAASIVGLILGLLSAFLGGVVFGALVLGIYILFAIGMIGVAGGMPALILLQLREDMHDRWIQVSQKKVLETDGGDTV